MKKRVVSLLLCLIMALSLIPTVAFAAEVGTGDAPATDANKMTTNGKYVSGIWQSDKDGTSKSDDNLVTLSKTAKPVNGQDNTYEITLSVVTSQTTTTTTTPADAATVLVIDTSGSMAWCTKNHRHTQDCYTEIECNATSNPDHWRTWNGYSYHRQFDDNWNYLSCYRKNGKYYQISDTCGQNEHNHRRARGGEWCRNTGEKSRIEYAKEAAKAFLTNYRDTTSSTPAARWVAIVSFADNATGNLTWYDVSTEAGYNSAVAAINALNAGGGTNLDAGLATAQTLMNDNTVQDILTTNKNVVALTDGAPTKAGNLGDGTYGSSWINDATRTTATNLKGSGINSLYTICFAASNEECYQGGPSVSDFLKDSIASTGKASTVDEGADLSFKFESISSTIKEGLTGDSTWTVTDPMADNISVVAASLPTTGFVKDTSTENTYIWTLSNPTQTPSGNTTTYTYTTSYNVTIDPTGLDADKFYPTNKVTTLHYKDANGTDKTADFPVPGVKVKISTPTEPEKGTLTINKTITGLDKAHGITFIVKDANGNAVSTNPIKINATDFKSVNGKNNEFTGSVEVKDLPFGEYTVAEDTDSAKVDGYTLTTTSTGLTDGKVNVTKEGAIVSFTNAYTEKAPDATTAKINITKNVNVTGNTQPTTMPTFQFVAKVDNTVVGNLYLTPKKGTDGKWTASGVMDITIPVTLFGDKDYVEVKVSEVKGTLTTWTYDTHDEHLNISKDGRNHVIVYSAAEVVPTDPIASFTFTNTYTYTYTPPTRPTNPIRRQPTTTTTKPVQSVKTGDMGIALYAVTSLLSLSGTALVIKKRKDEK